MLGALLKEKRKSNQLKLRELTARTGIDQTLLSRFEKGDRMPTQEQLWKLVEELKLNNDEAHVAWMTDKILIVVGYGPLAVEALQAAESRIEYLNSQSRFEIPQLSDVLQSRLDELDRLKKEWVARHPLNRTHLARLRDYFDVDYTYESNRIEGNTLSLEETALVVNQGLTIGGKSVIEHLEAINHKEAIGFIRDIVRNKEELSKRTVLNIHRLILKGIDNDNAGVYRNVPVRISGSDVELPQPFMLDKLMEDYFQFYALRKHTMNPVLLAAEMHERLVSIHPFIDGNGRTARLVMNLILTQHQYARVNIKGDPQSRLKYYKALSTVQKEGDSMPFCTLVADEAIRSLNAHLEWVN